MTQTALWPSLNIPTPATPTKKPRQKPRQECNADNYPPPPDSQNLENLLLQVENHLQQKAMPHLLANTAVRHQLRYQEDHQGLHLEYWASQDHTPAVFSVSRLKNHALRQTFMGTDISHQQVQLPGYTHEAWTHLLMVQLAQDILDSLGATALAPLLAHKTAGARLLSKISGAASDVQDQKTGPDLLPPDCPHRDKSTTMHKYFNRLIRTYITDPKRATAARRMATRGSTQPTAEEYNQAQDARDPIPPPRAPTLTQQDLPDRITQAKLAALLDQRIPGWTPFRYTVQEDGTKYLQVMTCGTRLAQFTVTADPQGIITQDPLLFQYKHRLNFNHETFDEIPIAQAATQIAEYLLADNDLAAELLVNTPDRGPFFWKRTTGGHTPIHITNGLRDTPLRLHQKAKETVQELLQPNVFTPTTARTPRTAGSSLDRMGHDLTRLARRWIADPHIISLADILPRGKGAWTLQFYNNFVRNKPLLDDALTSSRSAAQYYMQYIMPEIHQEVRLNDPGEIITAVKEHLDIDPALWRWFVRLRGEWQHDQRHRPDPNQLKAVCQLLKATNCTQPDPDRIRALLRMHYLTSDLMQDHDHNPRPLQAWVTACNRFLNQQQPVQYQQTSDLTHIGDAIVHHFRHTPDEPWGPGTWDQLVQRAHNLFQQRQQHFTYPPPPENFQWQSALPETDCGGFTFLPLTSSKELTHWGQNMHNCLATYGHRCHQGDDRIFIATNSDGSTAAAVQLHYSGETWQPVQIEGPRRTRPSDHLDQACRLLADQYAHAVRYPKNNGPKADTIQDQNPQAP